ncbi:MAG: MFS transporter [Coriobacteriales bacterium]|jgi:OFA family oxalate/formate antiporter-like MFS transporter|nr:MFS transporter [Coriobacteriales bacterium]
MSSVSQTASQLKSARIPYLAFATITLLILGLIYAWSIFAQPIGSEFGYKNLSIVFQVSMFAFCVSALFGAQLIKRTSAKLTIIVAAAMFAAGFVFTALTAQIGEPTLFIFYGILSASGCGIAYNAIISLVNPWFPDKVGLASGVMMMGFGVSSLLFGFIANMLFELLESWQPVFIMIAAAGAILMVILALFVKPAPKNLQEILTGKAAAAVSEKPKSSPTRDMPILKSKVFWFYSGWATLTLVCGLTVIGSAAQGAEALGVQDVTYAGFPTLLVGLVSTMNGIARVANGAIFDKVGLVPVMLIGALVATISMTGLMLAFIANIPYLYILAAILIAFNYGGVPVMASAYARQRYKHEDFAMNLGIANCNIASGAVINIILTVVLGAIAIRDPVTNVNSASENAPIIFGALVVCAILGFISALIFGKLYKADLAKIKSELEAS